MADGIQCRKHFHFRHYTATFRRTRINDQSKKGKTETNVGMRQRDVGYQPGCIAISATAGLLSYNQHVFLLRYGISKQYRGRESVPSGKDIRVALEVIFLFGFEIFVFEIPEMIMAVASLAGEKNKE